MAVLKSIEDLEDWTEYRVFMKERIKQLKEGASADFYISKEKHEFQVRGKAWDGYIILFGDKGSVAAKNLKKDGIMWREATCKLATGGKKLSVAGISSGLVQHAEKTIAKLGFDLKLEAGSGEDASVADSREADEKGIDSKLARRKKELAGQLRSVVALKPANGASLAKLWKEAEAREANADSAALTKILDRLERELDAANQAADAATQAGADAEKRAAALRKELAPEIKAAVDAKPANLQQVAALWKKAEAFLKSGDHASAITAYRDVARELENAPAPDAGPSKAETDAKQRKPKLAQRLKARLGAKPANAADLASIWRRAEAAESSDDYAAVLRHYEELEEALEVRDDAPDPAVEELKTRKAAMAKELKAALGEKPANAADLAKLWREFEAKEQRGDTAAAGKALDDLQAALQLGAVDEDDADDVDLDDLEDWGNYRAYIRSRLRKSMEDSPFYISRKKMVWRDDGKKVKAHAIIVGKKGPSEVKRFRKETGLPFTEATCTRKGKLLQLKEVSGATEKRTGILLKLLRLGFTAEILGQPLPDEKDWDPIEDADDVLGQEAQAEAAPDPNEAVVGRRKPALADQMKDVIQSRPANMAQLVQLWRRAQELETAKEFGEVLQLFDQLESELAAASAAPSAAETAYRDREPSVLADADAKLRELGAAAAADDIRKAKNFAQGQAADGEWESALRTLDRVERLVAEAQPVESRESSRVQYVQSLLALQDAKRAVEKQVSSLLSKVPDDLVEDLRAELEAVYEAVGDAVDQEINATEEQQLAAGTRLKREISSFIAQVDSNPIIQHVDQNPYVNVSIASTLGRALQDTRSKIPA